MLRRERARGVFFFIAWVGVWGFEVFVSAYRWGSVVFDSDTDRWVAFFCCWDDITDAAFFSPWMGWDWDREWITLLWL